MDDLQQPNLLTPQEETTQPVAPQDTNDHSPSLEVASPSTSDDSQVQPESGDTLSPPVDAQQIYPDTEASEPDPEVDNYQDETGMFSGRINRAGFLMAMLYSTLFYIISVALLVLVSKVAGVELNPFVVFIFVLLFILPIGVPVIGAITRRAHDMNKTLINVLFWTLAPLPIIVQVIGWLYLFIGSGTEGPNDYGEPYSGSLSVICVLFGK
ncbi:unnamed protein product [Sphagnum jensenii]|uniref:DUF805 domain-containing protein n=1 Tax=Sphagnum jensenii TaxID=128206 RepID=A0ABP0VBK8_9BRYO